MKMSSSFIATLREVPRDAETLSHQLMLRSGMLRKHAAGLYSYLPLMVRSYHRLCKILRDELDQMDWQEVMMPFVVPAELWQESGRWSAYGPELCRIKDRKQNEFCLGPTHEEVVTDLLRSQVTSYKQLPVTLYQITSKFRDEVRPRFGVMRAREFVMMDGYSFHTSTADLDVHYEKISKAYENIFRRAGLKFRRVDADTGAIGGNGSHEFHVLAQSGEDSILSCTHCNYAANLEKAQTPSASRQKKDWGTPTDKPFEKVSTPTQRTIEAVGEFLKIPPHRSLKTLVYKFNTSSDLRSWKPVVVFVMGDRQMNEVKLKTALRASGNKDVLDVVALAEADVETLFKCKVGFLGPVGAPQNVLTLYDHEVKAAHDMVAGANEEGFHLQHLEPLRDFLGLKTAPTFDLVNAVEGEVCPLDSCEGTLRVDRGIEVGHIFKLGSKYSQAMHAEYQNDQKQTQVIEMGCYGIGVTRVIAASIEQNHDADGIIWPMQLAPFDIHLLNLGSDDEQCKRFAEGLYARLKQRRLEVLLDDRDLSPGAKFKDSDLLGFPLRLTIGKKGLENKSLEGQWRATKEKFQLSFSSLDEFEWDRLAASIADLYTKRIWS